MSLAQGRRDDQLGDVTAKRLLRRIPEGLFGGRVERKTRPLASTVTTASRDEASIASSSAARWLLPAGCVKPLQPTQ